MWNYEKRLQFPINIKEPNAKLAQVIISQYGGPDGEMGASMRYLSQRYSMPYKEVAGRSKGYAVFWRTAAKKHGYIFLFHWFILSLLC